MTDNFRKHGEPIDFKKLKEIAGRIQDAEPYCDMKGERSHGVAYTSSPATTEEQMLDVLYSILRCIALTMVFTGLVFFTLLFYAVQR